MQWGSTARVIMLQHAVPSWSLAVVLGFTLASGAALSLATPVPRVAYLSVFDAVLLRTPSPTDTIEKEGW